jgi:type IV pilus assembly protein PilX
VSNRFSSNRSAAEGIPRSASGARRGNRSRQSGTALIVSLLLLLVLTVLGVVMMQTSRMEERMSGNTRDLNMALQGAESGLRYGEAVVAANADLPPDLTAIPCTVCAVNILPLAIYDPTQFNWTANAQTYGVGGVTAVLTGTTQQLAQEPQYTTEHVGFRPDDLSPNPPGIDYYQLTGRSTGVSGQANVVVQSTFGHRFR